MTDMYPNIDGQKLEPKRFILELYDEKPILNMRCSIGDKFNGYIRQVRIHQNWKIDVTEIGNTVTLGVANCYEYPTGLGNTCDVCSPIQLDTHEENTCYVRCTDPLTGYG